MNPEQRLSIREAVELIARYGEKPISESALRARAKTKRLGVSRVNGRIFTNPLNLASAGLLPIDVITSTVVPQKIDDDELHAWIDAPTGAAPPDARGPLERLLDEPAPRAFESTGSTEGDGEHGDDASPLADADPLGADEQQPPHDLRGTSDDTLDEFLDEASIAPPATPGARSDTKPRDPGRPATSTAGADDHVRRPLLTGSDGRGEDTLRRPRARRLVLASAAAIALLVVTVVALSAASDDQASSPGLSAAQIAAATSAREDRRQDVAIRKAAGRGDYDAAMQIAFTSGDRESYDEARTDASTALLTRARRALQDDRVETARRYVRRVERRYGDPDPGARRSVEDRIDRAVAIERRARVRARAERERRAAQTAAGRRVKAPAAAAQTPAPTQTTPSQSSAASESTTPVGSPASSAKSVPAPSSSKKPSTARDPEFF